MDIDFDLPMHDVDPDGGKIVVAYTCSYFISVP